MALRQYWRRAMKSKYHTKISRYSAMFVGWFFKPSQVDSDKKLKKMTKNWSFLAENGATPILANPSHLAYSWRILIFLIVISTLFTTRNFTVVIDYVNTIDFLGTLLSVRRSVFCNHRNWIKMAKSLDMDRKQITWN